MFTSPPIPSWYRGSVNCEWTIRVRQRYTIGMYLKLSWSRDKRCNNFIKISFNEGVGLHSIKLCGHEDVHGLLHFKTHEIRVHYRTEVRLSQTPQQSSCMKRSRDPIKQHIGMELQTCTTGPLRYGCQFNHFTNGKLWMWYDLVLLPIHTKFITSHRAVHKIAELLQYVLKTRVQL